jgi:hypothetical protein
MKPGFACIALLTVAVPAGAQPASLTPVKLTIHPAAAPRPALKYLLLPELGDLSHGNAAYLYQRAHSPELVTRVLRSPDFMKMFDWLDTPLKDFPILKAKGLLPTNALREVDLAARREYCDWELVDRLKKEGYHLLLPDIQGFRNFASFLALRARIEIYEKQFDKAVYTLQTGFALGTHVAEGPILITSLVGMAIVHVMTRQMEEMIQVPGSPNLYWALTALPRPLIPLRKALEGEKLWLDAQFPELRTIETKVLSPQQQETLVERLDRFNAEMYAGSGESKWERRLGTLAIAMKIYPAAKRALIAEGRKRADVEALPVLQVVLIHSLRQYREISDDVHKWLSFPYLELRQHVAEAHQRLKQARSSLNCLPFLIDTLPAIHKVFDAQARLDRKIAALRVIEALRLHAAANDGKLPASLGDVKEVPIPLDPVTNKEFVYKADGDEATLYGPPASGEAHVGNTIYYRLTLKR